MAPVSRTRPRENQVWVASGWCGRASDLLCTIPLHRPTCILQTESIDLSISLVAVVDRVIVRDLEREVDVRHALVDGRRAQPAADA